MASVPLAILLALAGPVAAQTARLPPVASISGKVVQVSPRELSAVVQLPADRSGRVVRIRTTRATSVWKGDAGHGIGRITPGDTVFARGTWMSSDVFAASGLDVDAVNEYGVVRFVQLGLVRLRLVGRNSLKPLVPARYDTLALNSHTMLDGKPQRAFASRLRAGSLIQVIGVRTGATAVTAVNVLQLTGVTRHRGR